MFVLVGGNNKAKEKRKKRLHRRSLYGEGVAIAGGKIRPNKDIWFWSEGNVMGQTSARHGNQFAGLNSDPRRRRNSGIERKKQQKLEKEKVKERD